MIITLLSGRDVESSKIQFLENTYHFVLEESNGEHTDITLDLSRVSKRTLVPNFDDSRENLRMSAEQGASKGKVYDERTNPLEIAVDDTAKDIKSIGSNVSQTAQRAGKSLPLVAIIVAGVLALVILAKE